MHTVQLTKFYGRRLVMVGRRIDVNMPESLQVSFSSQPQFAKVRFTFITFEKLPVYNLFKCALDGHVIRFSGCKSMPRRLGSVTRPMALTSSYTTDTCPLLFELCSHKYIITRHFWLQMHPFLVGRIEWDQWLLLKFQTDTNAIVVEVCNL